jgi:hypothetical protein
MPSVLVLSSRKRRAKEICPGLAEGARLAGYKVERAWAEDYREPTTEVLLHYGFDGSRESSIAGAFSDYVAAGLKAVYVDLGYFKNRAALGRYGDYHRWSINARHPNAHFQLRKHDSSRADALGIVLRAKMSQGRNIVLCGMSPKAAAFDGVPGWEEAAVVELRKHTERPIVYRPKPQRTIRSGRKAAPGAMSNGQLPPIDGTLYSDPLNRKLEHELADAWAVVSHHSNAGLDALVAGVPCFQEDGVALALGRSNLALIEKPRLPTFEERRQLVNDVCYTQWNAAEAAAGIAWRHYRDEGLL